MVKGSSEKQIGICTETLCSCAGEAAQSLEEVEGGQVGRGQRILAFYKCPDGENHSDIPNRVCRLCAGTVQETSTL